MNTIKTIIPATNGADLDGIPDFLMAKNRPGPTTNLKVVPGGLKAPPVAPSKKATSAKASPKKPASKAPKAAKAPPKEARAKTAPAKPKPDEAGESKTEAVGRLLRRKEGCTTAEILAETKWPAVSVPQMAKANDLKLRKEKVKGQPMRYFGS